MPDLFENLTQINARVFREYNEAIEESKGKSEEKLKVECERINGNLLRKLGISLDRDYETGDLVDYSRKRPDALYRNVRIEYKAVGVLQSAVKRDEIINKVITEYLDRAEDREAAVGIIFDGTKIIITRGRNVRGKINWDTEVLDFGESSLFEMLLLLVNLGKHRLTAESLQHDFDTTGQLGKRVLHLLLGKISRSKDGRTRMLYAEWDKRFSSIYKQAFENDRVRRDFRMAMHNLQLEEGSFDRFLFATQSYYALIVKLIASEAASTLSHGLVNSYILALSNASDLKASLSEIEEEGGIFRKSLSISNFCEGDFFSWYLEEWDAELEDAIRDILRRLQEYNFRTFAEKPEETTDLLKRFYQYIVPQRIRHDLGEYYTPDWLAQHALLQAGYDGDAAKKVLDPACGSGTFLVQVIKKILLAHRGKRVHVKTLIKLITENVVGFDINPVAVLTARTNYLLALSPLLQRERFEQLTIPVFLADSIIIPEESSGLRARAYLMRTTKGEFRIPSAIVEKRIVDSLLSDVELCCDQYTEDEFAAFAKRKYDLDSASLGIISEMFSRIRTLGQKNEDGVWTKIIKNAFAPVFRRNQFDYVVGNPPWVNWEFLSDEYAGLLKELSSELGIFVFKGSEARHGFAKDDLAAIFMYACSKYYLADGGKLAFLIKPLFQNPAGKGFRKFRFNSSGVGSNEIPLNVKLVEDLKDIHPFEGASNETAAIFLTKGERTIYPVSFVRWTRKRHGEIGQTETLESVLKLTDRERLRAEPSDETDSTSSWLITSKKEETHYAELKESFLGEFEYPIRQGVNFGISTVFWFDIRSRHGSKIRIRNSSEAGKKFRTAAFETTIERDLVFPLIKSRHVSKWKIHSHIYSLIPQQKTDIDNERDVKTRFPETYQYLQRYHQELANDRKSVWFKGSPFYKIYGLGKYTWSPFKVVWTNLGYKPEFVVVSTTHDETLGTRPVIPEHALSFISEREKDRGYISLDEAHYLCAILNSAPMHAMMDALSHKGKSGLTKSLIDKLRVARYNPQNPLHHRLSELSKMAHKIADSNNHQELVKLEEEITGVVLQLYAKNERRSLARWLLV